MEIAFQRHWCAKNEKNSEKKSSKQLWPWECLLRGEILVSSTNAVSSNLISEGYIKCCGIHSQHDLRSTTWTRNFLLLFPSGSWYIFVVGALSTKQIYHILQKLVSTSKILEFQKIDLLLVSRFFFCRGMHFLLIHFYKFIICCRLLLYIHNLSFSRIFTACILFLLLSFFFTINRTVYHTFIFHKVAENEAWSSGESEPEN